MKAPEKTVVIAKYLLKELKRIHEEKLSNKMVNDEDFPRFRFKKDLVDYVFESTNLKRPDEVRREEKKRGGKGSLAENACASENTVMNAINLLLKENLIHRVDGEYCFKPRLATNRDKHPILSIASKINITINVPESLLVLTAPQGFAENLAAYLSAQFHKGDILFIPFGSYILCVGVLPEAILQGEMSQSLEDEEFTPIEIMAARIQSVLGEFCCNYPAFPFREMYEMAYASHYDPATKAYLHRVAENRANADVVGQAARLTVDDYYASVRNVFANWQRINKQSNRYINKPTKTANEDIDDEGVLPEVTREEVEAFYDDRFDEFL